jgi:hypothetical protein
MLRKVLLYCGIMSTLLYIAMNIFVPMRYAGYSSMSQTVSELSAIGAPTRPLWAPLGMLYAMFLIGFGAGVWWWAGRKRALRVVGARLLAYGAFGLAWPPMHQRAVLAAGGGTLTDTLHLVWGGVTVLLMFLFIAFGANAFGTRFRLYSIGTILILLVFGGLTGLDASRVGANLPTPWVGVWERISIFASMLWIAVLGVCLLRARDSSVSPYAVTPAVTPREMERIAR